MEKAFKKFKEEFNGKSLNEILGCAKNGCEKLTLITDVDEYDDNEFACVVRWYEDYTYNEDKSIIVECKVVDGEVQMKLRFSKVTKFGRRWDIIRKFDKDEKDDNDNDIWWEVLKMEDGVLWMNNCDGYMVFVCNNGQLLQTYF